MAKKAKAADSAKKEGAVEKASLAPEGKMARTGDQDVDTARARSADGDTANDPAGEGVKTTAEKAGIEAEGEDDVPESSSRARTAPSGHPDNAARLEGMELLEGASHETLTVVSENAAGTPIKKHTAAVLLRTSAGDEYEFGVSHPDTARQLANAFSGAADELSRRRA